MSRPLLDPAVVLALRASFALLLASAALHKLGDLARFRAVLEAYRILPWRAVPAAAVAVALVESCVALALATGVMPAGAGITAATMFVAYAAAIHANVRRGRTDIDCGCTGPSFRVPVGNGLVVRNIILAAAALLLAAPQSSRQIGALDLLSIAGLVGALSASWLASERLFALAPRAAALRRRAA